MRILLFDIGGTSIKCGVWEQDALSQIQEIPTQAHLGGPHIMETLLSLISAQTLSFDAIGVSTAGQVHAEEGRIIYANSNIPHYTGTPIRQMLESRFSVPVMVENDVNAAAIGEAVYGAGRAFSDFLCLTYGTGVGGAIVQNRSIYHGSTYSAGEFGALVTHGEDKCRGSDPFDGCYERYASTTALVQAASAYDPALQNGRLIFARREEPAIRQIIDDWITEILLGLSSLIHIFNPPCVILGGGIMAQPSVTDAIAERIDPFLMSSFRQVRILPAELQNTAGLLGIQHLTEQYAKGSVPHRK